MPAVDAPLTPDMLTRLAEFVSDRPSRAAVLARALLGRPLDRDPMFRRQLIGGILGAAGADGSVRGSLVATARAAVELAELGQPAAARAALLDWLATRQGAPGAFHLGCTAARHQHRACEHFLDGFFSAAPPTRRVAPLALANGKEFRVESQARFAASCLALEAMLRSGRQHDPLVERHLDSFASLIDEWATGSDYFHPDLVFSALAALAAAPARWRPTVEAIVGQLAAQQQPDGTWTGTEFFHSIDALARVDGPVVAPLLTRAVTTLGRRQREDGSFGSAAEDERALIAARVLRQVG